MTCPCGCGEPRHYCYGCGQNENTDGAYRICIECGHVFPSEADLIAQDLDARRAGLLAAGHPAAALGRDATAAPTPAASGDDVWTCPVCNHDF